MEGGALSGASVDALPRRVVEVELVGGRVSLCAHETAPGCVESWRRQTSVGEGHGGSLQEEKASGKSEVGGEARGSGVMGIQEWCSFRDFT